MAKKKTKSKAIERDSLDALEQSQQRLRLEVQTLKDDIGALGDDTEQLSLQVRELEESAERAQEGVDNINRIHEEVMKQLEDNRRYADEKIAELEAHWTRKLKGFKETIREDMDQVQLRLSNVENAMCEDVDTNEEIQVRVTDNSESEKKDNDMARDVEVQKVDTILTPDANKPELENEDKPSDIPAFSLEKLLNAPRRRQTFAESYLPPMDRTLKAIENVAAPEHQAELKGYLYAMHEMIRRVEEAPFRPDLGSVEEARAALPELFDLVHGPAK